MYDPLPLVVNVTVPEGGGVPGGVPCVEATRTVTSITCPTTALTGCVDHVTDGVTGSFEAATNTPSVDDPNGL